MSFEHALFAEMGEELSSWHELHEHVEISGILGEPVEIDLSKMKCTTKGWEIVLRILY